MARALGTRVTRFWPTIAGVFAAGAIFSTLALPKLVTPVYRSETVLLYREGIQANQTRGGEEEVSRRIGPRLKDMLLARMRLEQIIDEFGLYPATIERYGKIDAIEELRSHIDFKAREGDTFHITFDGENPQIAYAVTSRLADGLVEENSRLRVQQASATKDFLEAEKRRSDEDMRVKERDLATFLAEHPEFADEGGGKGGPSAGASVRAQEKKERDLKTASSTGGSNLGLIFALERQAARLRERIKNPSAPPSVSPRAAAAVDPKLLAAKSESDSQLANARRELSEKSARFTDQHPDVVAARGKVAAAEAGVMAAQRAINEAQIRADAAADEAPVQADGSADVEALKTQLSKVERDIASLRIGHKRAEGGGASDQAISDAANGIVALETTWTRLNRDVLEARERGQQLMDRLFRASIAANVESSGGAAQMVVVDPAFMPIRPFSYGKMRVMAAGLVVSLVLGCIAALMRAIFDQRLYDEFDVHRLNLTSLAGWRGAYPLVHSVPRPAEAAKKGTKVKS